MFKNRSLNFKLRASFGALVILLLFVGGVNIQLLKKTTDQYKHITEVNLQNAIILKHLDTGSREILRRFLQYTIKGNVAKDMERIDKAIVENLADYEIYRKKYEAVEFVPGEAELYDEVKKN